MIDKKIVVNKGYLKNLLTFNQTELFEHIVHKVSKNNNYNTTAFNKSGIIVIPKSVNKYPLICSHLDTINDSKKIKLQNSDIEIDGDIIRLSESSLAKCLGGDDRCGVYTALQLIDLGFPFGFAFFCDEEVGCIASSMLAKNIDENESITAFIGLDRRGLDNVAVYGYDNSDLINLFENEGYIEVNGSITDVSLLSEQSSRNLACVNLSVGYYNEHTKREFINIFAIQRAIKTLIKLCFVLSKKAYTYNVSDYYSLIDYRKMMGY